MILLVLAAALITFDNPALHAILIFLELLFQDFFSRTEQLNS